MADNSNTTTTTTPAPGPDMVVKNVLDISDDTILHDRIYENPITFIKNVVAERALPNTFRTRNKFYGRFITQLYEQGEAGKEGDGMWDRVLSAIKQSSTETVQEANIFVAVVHVEELQSFDFPQENDFKAIERIARNGGIFKSYVYALNGGATPKYGDLCLVSFNDPETRSEGIFEHPVANGASSSPGTGGGAGAGSGGGGGGSGRRGGGGAGRGYRYCRETRSTSEQVSPPSGGTSAAQTTVETTFGSFSFPSTTQPPTPPPVLSSTPPPAEETSSESQMSGAPEPPQSTVDQETPTPPPKSRAQRRAERRRRLMATCKPAAPLSALGQQYGIIDIRHLRRQPPNKRRPWGAIKGIVLHQVAVHIGDKPNRWAKVEVHFGVTRSGKIYYIQDIPEKSAHAQSYFNNFTVGIEFDGWFAGVDGDLRTLWTPSGASAERKQPMGKSAAQIAAGKKLLDFIQKETLANGGKITKIHAHRQTSASRTSCPGEIIWKNLGVWAQQAYGWSDGGDGYFVQTGRPIPRQWDPNRTAIYRQGIG